MKQQLFNAKVDLGTGQHQTVRVKEMKFDFIDQHGFRWRKKDGRPRDSVVATALPHARLYLRSVAFDQEGELFEMRNTYLVARTKGARESGNGRVVPVYRLKKFWVDVHGFKYNEHGHGVGKAEGKVLSISSIDFSVIASYTHPQEAAEFYSAKTESRL